MMRLWRHTFTANIAIMNDWMFVILFLMLAFVANEVVLIFKRKRKRVEYRVFKTLVNSRDKESYYAEDHIWIQDGKVIKVITHDGIIGAKCYPGLVRALDGGGINND